LGYLQKKYLKNIHTYSGLGLLGRDLFDRIPAIIKYEEAYHPFYFLKSVYIISK
jgi:hypothetical protein